MKIAIGSDHAGYELKQLIIGHLKQKNIEVIDKGTYSEERADYPDFAHAVATIITNNEANFGILICGSGNGINITANKHANIRAALSWKPEIAQLARQHNNANILTLPARFIDVSQALLCVDVFLDTDFEGGRHEQRVAKIKI